MKLFNSILILTLFLLSSSCSKDDFDKQSDVNSNLQVRSSRSDLLIQSILFDGNMFHFPDQSSFNAVKREISEKTEEYENYFLEKQMNFSSFDHINSLMNKVNDELSDSEIDALLSSHNVTPNKFGEIDYKFNMLYKNLLLNLDGVVKIGDLIVVYSSQAKMLFNSLVHFKEFKKGGREPLEVIPIKVYSNSDRALESSCECRNDFDPGKRCGDRRIRGKLDIEFDAYGDSVDDGCIVDYEIYAQTRWYKKRLGVWWWTEADSLNVGFDVNIFNTRGHNGLLGTAVCNLERFRGEVDVNKVQIATNLVCSAIIIGKPEECRSPYDDDTHGIRSADSSHWGTESGKCGGTASCQILSCN